MSNTVRKSNFIIGNKERETLVLNTTKGYAKNMSSNSTFNTDTALASIKVYGKHAATYWRASCVTEGKATPNDWAWAKSCMGFAILGKAKFNLMQTPWKKVKPSKSNAKLLGVDLKDFKATKNDKGKAYAKHRELTQSVGSAMGKVAKIIDNHTAKPTSSSPSRVRTPLEQLASKLQDCDKICQRAKSLPFDLINFQDKVRDLKAFINGAK